jgi:thymidine kinase
VSVGSFQLNGGWIEVISGVMFSGKSEELMRRVRRSLIARKRVQVFKSHLDDRYAGGVYAVGSHDGRTIDAVPVDSSHQITLRLDPQAQVDRRALQRTRPARPTGDRRRHRHRLPR